MACKYCKNYNIRIRDGMKYKCERYGTYEYPEDNGCNGRSYYEIPWNEQKNRDYELRR